jgi:hypothetical protein
MGLNEEILDVSPRKLVGSTLSTNSFKMESAAGEPGPAACHAVACRAMYELL